MHLSIHVYRVFPSEPNTRLDPIYMCKYIHIYLADDERCLEALVADVTV